MAKKKQKNDLANEMQVNILAIFKQNPYTELNYRQIAGRLGISEKKERHFVQQALDELVMRDILYIIRRGKYQLNPDVIQEIAPPSVIQGRVDMKSTGKAYIISPESEDDIFISANNTGAALPDDIVKVRLFPRRKNQKPEGEIIEVVQRRRTQFAGVIQLGKKAAFFIPDDERIPHDFFIPRENLSGAKDGEKVVVEISEWSPAKSKSPIAEVKHVLGKKGKNDVEMQSILVNAGFPLGFPAEVEKEAAMIAEQIPETEIKKREDFRNVFTITIDPHDAKDFDDALSLRQIDEKIYEVGVHIADVAHYIRPGGKLDQEAYQRATSIYLVDRVIPMLPEKLSNEVCSLKPHVDRLCFSVVFDMDMSGKVLKHRIVKTMINSTHRLNYEEAQEIIEGTRPDFEGQIGILNKIAGELRKVRFQRGAINFRSTEVKFKLDKEGKPLEIYLKETKESNNLVEEFMLLANRTVAAEIGNVKGKNTEAKPFVYRVHDEPSPEKLGTFSIFLRKLGYKLTLGEKDKISRSLNKLFDDVHGKPEETMIETIAVRTMAKAYYSSVNIGHYGLAFPFYSHFTSPIRRYPDLMVHRLLDAYLLSKKKSDTSGLEEECKHCSLMEQRAAEAERESVKYKQAEYMLDKIGQKFSGVISGVSKWGVYVEIENTKCEGMVRLSDMKDDFYYLDEDNYMVIGHRNKISYRLGDKVNILVKKIDLSRKQMDFEIV